MARRAPLKTEWETVKVRVLYPLPMYRKVKFWNQRPAKLLLASGTLARYSKDCTRVVEQADIPCGAMMGGLKVQVLPFVQRVVVLWWNWKTH